MPVTWADVDKSHSPGLYLTQMRRYGAEMPRHNHGQPVSCWGSPWRWDRLYYLLSGCLAQGIAWRRDRDQTCPPSAAEFAIHNAIWYCVCESVCTWEFCVHIWRRMCREMSRSTFFFPRNLQLSMCKCLSAHRNVIYIKTSTFVVQKDSSDLLWWHQEHRYQRTNKNKPMCTLQIAC